ncbi:MAG TPA: response regulator [Candidatus Wallbacteria bacterium]|nr:MAG: putative transcriptional regulatory protein pdtaR [bacterium ADurb.Bin243]HOD42545.1 response regulator [Candidatus Wallbacteria bacterium]HPG56811.1 response regulator [Candidatus Wallbacteria bacterium]
MKLNDLKVMIVEDEALAALLLTKFLNKLGCVVTCAVANGNDAIAKADETKPDLIFMDIRLADEIDGITAAAAILEKRKTNIVFMSAYSDKSIVEKAMKLNPMAFVNKPLTLEKLKNLIESSPQG